MSDVPFFLTRQGRELLESTIPRMLAELEKMNESLARLVVSLEEQKGKPPG